MAKQLYRYATEDEIAGLLRGPSQQQTQLYNALGRNASTTDNGDSDNFFVKRGKSIENALGTTGSALVSLVDTGIENANIEKRNKEYKDSLKNVANKYGFATLDDFYDASDAADKDILSKYNFDFADYEKKRQEAADKNDQAKLNELDDYKLNFIEKNVTGDDANKLKNFVYGSRELRGQASSNFEDAKKHSEDWKNYRENSYVGKKINQDRGKFLGSAINTLSTAADVALPAAGVAFNTVQGGVEGIADELEQNGLKDFDWNRAGQNALVGATTGAVVGGLNKGINSALAKRGGNLLKGGNKLTKAINNFNANNALGQVASTVGTGAARGALSGAVGGATGAGLSAALNNQDVLASAVEGAKRGASQGALAGGVMSGANIVANKTPGIKDVMQGINEASEDWKNAGDTFGERWKNTRAENTWGNRLLNNGVENIKAVGNGFKNVGQGTAMLAQRGIDALNESPLANVGMGVKDVSNMQNPDVRKLNSLNPTGTVNTEYDPTFRATAPLGEDLTTYDRTANINPDQEITIYRGVPNDAQGINAGDYVTTNRQLAQDYAGNGRVIEERVPASSLLDSVSEPLGEEYIYRPQKQLVQDILPNDIRNMSVNRNDMLNYTGDNTEPITVERALGRQNTKQVSPETDVYRTLTGETNDDINSAFNTQNDNTFVKRNKAQMLGTRLQDAAKKQKYSALYDSLDEKTAMRAVDTNAPEKLSGLGFEPENYGEFAKTSNYINGVVDNLAKKSNVKVELPDLPLELAPENIDVALTTDGVKKYNDYIKQIVADGDNPSQYTASGLLEKSRWLGNKAEKIAKTSTGADVAKALKEAKYILRNYASNALDNAGVFGDVTDDNIANGLARLGFDEKVQDYYANAVDGKSPTAGDLIRRSSLAEQARDMYGEMAKTKLRTSASHTSTNPLTQLYRSSGLEEPVNALLRSTVAPIAGGLTKGAGRIIESAGNLYAKATGNGGSITPNTTITTSTVTPNNVTPATQIYNMIGRTEGNLQNEQARSADYLAKAAQEAEIVQNGNNMQLPDTSTSLYDQFYGTGGNAADATLANNTTSNKAGYFDKTGDYWTDLLASAMSSAIDADDVNAFAALYGMYQDQISKLQKQNSSSQKLTSTQQRANAAADSLSRLENMTPDLAYDLSNIPIIGNIATFGGNDYESEAKSLAQQIGYMVSGANIKEEEAYNIGKAYVPQPFDNEVMRRNKLERARRIIAQYQNGVAES